ncbi:transposase [Streptomyces sp. NPDC056002]|uniref:transposase n=1 Tax=Streptomyces sp. NPDC056002 TaxID=3345675 RepID=UPI0035D886F8
MRTREACTDFEAKLKQLNSEKDHVHLLVHHPPRPSPPSWSTPPPPGVCARSATRTSAATCRAATPGPLLLRRKLRR